MAHFARPRKLTGCDRSVSLRHGGFCRLNSPRLDTPWTVIRDGTVDAASRPSPNPCGVRLGDGSTLSRRQADWPTCFRLFSHASRHSFQLSFKLLCAIGSRTCLGLGDVFSRIRSEILIRPTLFYEASVLLPTGPSPSSAYCSKYLRLRTLRRTLPHCPDLSRGLRLGLCFFHSPLLKVSLLLSFPALTMMLRFSAYPFGVPLRRRSSPLPLAQFGRRVGRPGFSEW